MAVAPAHTERKYEVTAVNLEFLNTPKQVRLTAEPIENSLFQKLKADFMRVLRHKNPKNTALLTDSQMYKALC